MRVAVIGAGSLGSVVAFYLTKAGVETVLVGRKEGVDAINRNGLKVGGLAKGEVVYVRATVVLEEEYDLVIFASQVQDLLYAYQDNCEFLEDCEVLTLQRGVRADNILGMHFSQDKMFVGIVMFGASFVGLGEVSHDFAGDLIIGSPNGRKHIRMNEIVETLGRGISVCSSVDILNQKWLKLFLDFHYCIPALINKTVKETFEDIELCRIGVMLLKEGLKVSAMAGVTMESLPVVSKENMKVIMEMPMVKAEKQMQEIWMCLEGGHLYGGILESIKLGRKSEIEFINGEPVFMAKQMRKLAPLNEKVLNMVNKVERTGIFYSVDEVKKEFFSV